MTLINAFLVALASLFSEIFARLQNLRFKFLRSFSKNSSIPIVRMFHEALKDK